MVNKSVTNALQISYKTLIATHFWLSGYAKNPLVFLLSDNAGMWSNQSKGFFTTWQPKSYSY